MKTILLSILLAAGLAAGAGCAVLPVALQRPLPSTGMALEGIETTQRSLAETRTYSGRNLGAVGSGRPVSAHGSAQAAYQRWVDDEVRELPSPASTVAIMGGSS